MIICFAILTHYQFATDKSTDCQTQAHSIVSCGNNLFDTDLYKWLNGTLN